MVLPGKETSQRNVAGLKSIATQVVGFARSPHLFARNKSWCALTDGTWALLRTMGV